MREREVERTAVPRVSITWSRSATRGIGVLVIGLSLVASLLVGCVIVPVGYGYGHEWHGYWHYRHDR